MKVAILGLWHLGSVYAACAAKFGHTVAAYDENEHTILNLNKGKAPLYEPSLDELISQGLSRGNLKFSDNLKETLKNAEIVWITYDTPVDDNDNADCDFVIDRVKPAIDNADKNSIVLVSSQLPAGSIKKLEAYAIKKNRTDLSFACSPENLRLGKAIEVFSNPDRIICGVRNDKTKERLLKLFSPITDKIEFMGVESAEVTKHAINAFLAMSVVFANEIAKVCEMENADAKEVEKGLKTESRIGKQAYVGPGLAFAGGTLARDISFLSKINKDSILFPAVFKSNAEHKQWVINKTKEISKTLKNKKIAVLGLTYKPGTDTLRRSTAVEYAKQLSGKGAIVSAFDPAVKILPKELKNIISLADSPYLAAKDADILIIATCWKDFLDINPAEIIKIMKSPNIIDPTRFLQSQFANTSNYYAVGLSSKGGR